MACILAFGSGVDYLSIHYDVMFESTMSLQTVCACRPDGVEMAQKCHQLPLGVCATSVGQKGGTHQFALGSVEKATQELSGPVQHDGAKSWQYSQAQDLLLNYRPLFHRTRQCASTQGDADQQEQDLLRQSATGRARVFSKVSKGILKRVIQCMFTPLQYMYV